MAYADLKNCKIITAFITPFHEDDSINFEAIPDLIEHLLAHHTDGILLAGTTAVSVLSVISAGVWLIFYIGRINIGQGAFALVGGYTFAILAIDLKRSKFRSIFLNW